MKNLSNLIVPRINVNSDSSINETIGLIQEFDFNAFILFATEKVVFKEESKFSLERLNYTREQLEKNSDKDILFFIDAENGLGHRCSDYNELPRMEFNEINLELYENQISFNLAPVVDINEFREKILEERCYSNNPKEVTKIANLFIEAAYSNNVIPCIKHFPGHGAAKGDTHTQIVNSDLSLDRINSTHLKPFLDLIDKVELIMMNHVHYSSIDTESVPASMSKNIMDILRNQNYKGIIISDSIRMGGIANQYTQEKIIEEFILNGGDLILDPLNPKDAIAILNKIYKAGNEDVIENKINLIDDLKSKAIQYLAR
ncbi:MAG: glycoside hydrolase family 3 N-terminal domain-containing protein [Thermodesulfobacteriota bacterium]|nr:glycoside hydrolase family 3 N-terminal domain-containing protein [Thermodesulfobacteriota bacterium]MEE2975714.1 glycoside hydrolase family 3 N-terminal domain-containing protein [Thermodesulfobacteriota bacterium]